MSRLALPGACLLAVALSAGQAAAQSAEAEELFKQGRQALEAGDPATACTKLAASERLEKAVGTLISLASCEEALGRLAGARQHLQEAADWADAKNDPLHRGPIARARFAALDKRVPRLTLKLAPGAPPQTRVARDDVDLGSAGFDAALPVDPGHHTLVISAAGHEPATLDVDLAEGDLRTLTVSPGKTASVAVPLATTPVDGPPPLVVGPRGGWSTQRTAGLLVGAIGLAGVGLGAYLGLTASSKWSDARSACTPGACGPGSTAQNDKGDAQTAATASTITFLAGGAAVVGGAILFLTGHARAEVTAARKLDLMPFASAGGGGIVLRATFL